MGNRLNAKNLRSDGPQNQLWSQGEVIAHSTGNEIRLTWCILRVVVIFELPKYWLSVRNLNPRYVLINQPTRNRLLPKLANTLLSILLIFIVMDLRFPTLNFHHMSCFETFRNHIDLATKVTTNYHYLINNAPSFKLNFTNREIVKLNSILAYYIKKRSL